MTYREHGGHEWILDKNFLDFSASINPLGFPAEVRTILENEMDNIARYPQPENYGLKKILAEKHTVNTKNILLGNGSIEIIYLLAKEFVRKSALIPVPTFCEYACAVQGEGKKILFIQRSEEAMFELPIEKMIDDLKEVDCLFLCNPNNPTGTFTEKNVMMEILAACKKNDVDLIIDEAFIDFSEEMEDQTMIREAAKEKGLLVMRSLTKIYGLAGLRIGYLVGDEDVVGRLSSSQYPWNVNNFALAGASAAVKNEEFVKKTQRLISRERDFLFKQLSLHTCIKVYPSNANYLLCKLLDCCEINNSDVLKKKLLSESVVVRYYSDFEGLDNSYFRVAVRGREENEKLIDAINITLDSKCMIYG